MARNTFPVIGRVSLDAQATRSTSSQPALVAMWLGEAQTAYVLLHRWTRDTVRNNLITYASGYIFAFVLPLCHALHRRETAPVHQFNACTQVWVDSTDQRSRTASTDHPCQIMTSKLHLTRPTTQPANAALSTCLTRFVVSCHKFCGYRAHWNRP